MNITSDFFTATMKATALKIARMAQTDKAAAQSYFEMHAREMNENEVEIFGNAVIDAAIQLAA